MDAPRRQLFAEVMKRAVVTPLSLGVLTASILLLLSPPLWPLALFGLLAEALLVQARVRDGQFVTAVREDAHRLEWRHQAARLAGLRAALDPPTGELLEQIQQLHERLSQKWEAPASSGWLSGDSLGFSRQQVRGLLDQCLRLVEKRQPLLAYLKETRPAELQREAVQLQERWDRCHDDVARQLYEHALRQKQSELENYGAIQAAVTRIDGQLEAIRCSFGNLLGRVIRLQSADATHAVGARDQLCRELSELIAGVTAVEDSVNETLSR